MRIDKDIKFYGNTHKVPITLDDTLCFLCRTIDEHECKEILEIGTAIGFGSITMAVNTKCTHIDTIELDTERYNIAVENITKHNLNDKISVYHMDAMEYIKDCTKTYDLIYLDGPKGQYINYLPYLIDLLNVGGVIVADNLNFHGMVTGEIPVTKGCRSMIKGLHKYIEAITTDDRLDTVIYKNLGDGVGVSIRK